MLLLLPGTTLLVVSTMTTFLLLPSLVYSSSSSSAISCLLTSESIKAIQYNETTSQYDVVAVMDDDDENDDEITRRNLRMRRTSPTGTTTRSLHALDNNTVAFVRECWCATSPDASTNDNDNVNNNNNNSTPDVVVPYCPIEFDVCSVSTSSSSGHECWHQSRIRKFLRGFVPAYLFFLGCLVYAFAGSEQGSAARQYILRKCWYGRRRTCCCCNQQQRTERQALEDAVDRLQRQNPNRAAWLFLQALRRIRLQQRSEWDRQQRRAAMQERRRQRRRRGRSAAVSGDNNNNNSREEEQQEMAHFAVGTAIASNDELPVFVVPADEVAVLPSKLELKTRRYSVVVDTKNSSIAEYDDEEEGEEGDECRSTTFQAKGQIDENNASSPSPTERGNASAEDEEQQHQQHGQKCSICLVELMDGDRVGDLSCQHLFHVSCLKDWLKRKNACPLCNQDDVATPLFDENENNDENCNDDNVMDAAVVEAVVDTPHGNNSSNDDEQQQQQQQEQALPTTTVEEEEVDIESNEED